jgi:L-galactose dehydrogenase
VLIVPHILGQTGLMLSPIGLGASSLGGGVFGAVAEQDAIRTVHLALDRGVRLIDVAPFYAYTRAETVLGKALRDVPRDRYVLATKVGRYGDDEFDFSIERVRRSMEESLSRLGVDYVDLIQAHDVEYGDLRQIQAETIPALHRLVDEGKARFVGATGYPLKPLRYLAEHARLDTVLSYNHLSLNDTTLLNVLPEFNARGVGVINAAPLSQGLLTNRGTPPWHPAPDTVKAACGVAAQFVRSRGSDIAKFAVQFSTRQPGVATTLIGTADPQELERNLQWAEEPVDEELLALVQAKLAPIRNVSWTTGRTENN